jgi:hypothetical protein
VVKDGHLAVGHAQCDPLPGELAADPDLSSGWPGRRR